MSISKERWIKTGDPRSGNEVYDDEGNESCCSECGDGLEPKTPEDRVYVALFNAHRECLEALTPADHAERVKKLVHAWQDAAWLKFEADCKRSGMVASAYTAFKCGYRAGKFDYETEAARDAAKTKCHEEAMTHFRIADEDLTPVIQAARFGFEKGVEYARGGGWAAVSERLPDREMPCLVVRKGRRYVEMLVFNHFHRVWDGADGDDYECDLDAVSVWMPLPEPPKS